jgi:hypothetical protein
LQESVTPEPAPGFPVTIEHALGTTTVPAPPTRIVALSFEEDVLSQVGVATVGAEALGRGRDGCPDGDAAGDGARRGLGRGVGDRAVRCPGFPGCGSARRPSAARSPRVPVPAAASGSRLTSRPLATLTRVPHPNTASPPPRHGEWRFGVPRNAPCGRLDHEPAAWRAIPDSGRNPFEHTPGRPCGTPARATPRAWRWPGWRNYRPTGVALAAVPGLRARPFGTSPSLPGAYATGCGPTRRRNEQKGRQFEINTGPESP